MAPDRAHQPEDDSSSASKRCNDKTENLGKSRSDGRKSRKNDSNNINLMCTVSTTSHRLNALQRSSIDTADSTAGCAKEKESVGGRSSLRPYSTSSSTISPKEIDRKLGCFRTLLDDALTKVVAATLASTSSSPCNKELQQEVQQPLSRVGREGELLYTTGKVHYPVDPLAIGNSGILQKLVQEKHTKCLVLQQKIDSKDSEIVQLQTMVENLRQSKKQEASNVKNLQMALKRASQNATSARDEANKAEATSTALMMQVEAFEKVVQETKRASALLLQEQEEIGVGVEGMENEFIQLQAKLACHSVTKQNIQQENRSLKEQLRTLEKTMDQVQEILENEENERLLMKRKYSELEEITQVKESQCKRLQEDLDSAQHLSLDSASVAAELEHALKNCKQAMDRMEEANRHLHHQIQKHQATSRKQEASHQDELNRAKKDHQETQLQLSDQKERFRTLKLQKLAADKRQESQSAKLFALERRLKDSTNLMATTVSITPNSRHSDANDPSNGSSAKEEGVDTRDSDNSNENHSSKTTGSFSVPRLDEKESPRIPYSMKKCSICLKDSSGLMKKCECGRKGCRFRAHATCVQHRFAGMPRPHLLLVDDATGAQQEEQLLVVPPPAAVILCRSPRTSSSQNIPP